MDITPKMSPYWVTLEEHEGEDQAPRFSLAPLTQPQIGDLMETYTPIDDGKRLKPTTKTFYLAGRMALSRGDGVEYLTIAGRAIDVRKSEDLDQIPYAWVVELGAKAFIDAHSDNEAEAEKN